MSTPLANPSRPLSARIGILGNPTSGRGQGAVALRELETRVRALGTEPVMLRTERPGHAEELVAAAAEGLDRLLVAGGDGTLRDASAGLVRAGAVERVTVGIIPAGTGNDFIRTLGTPRNLDEAIRVALGEVTREVDLWNWNGTPFINLAGVGFDAAVAGAVNRRFKKLAGTTAYVAAVLATIPRFTPPRLHLRWDGGEWEGKAWLAAFGNGRCYGGGMKITPAAEPDDGLLDITVIGDMSRLELFRQFPTLFSGSHVRHPAVRTFRVPWVEVEAEPMEATIDGELIDRTPARVERYPRRLRIAVG